LKAAATALGIPLPFANGGVIAEPVWGIGKSGKSYLFGERGNEVVIPQRNYGLAGQTLNINVNGILTGSGTELHAIIKAIDKSNNRYK
jgi:hypothetical protein